MHTLPKRMRLTINERTFANIAGDMLNKMIGMLI